MVVDSACPRGADATPLAKFDLSRRATQNCAANPPPQRSPTRGPLDPTAVLAHTGSDALMIGAVFLHHYKAVSFLGKGAMGSVYLARHDGNSDVAVVKVMNKEC